MEAEPGDDLPRSEDYLLERKTKSDLKDLLKTMVAFANSVRPGHVATILIGERDDGTPEGLSRETVDSVQKTVRKEAEKIYPPMIWSSKAYDNAGKRCIRVEIEHSGDTPHFGGQAWVRKGSESVLATDEEFQRLIDLRLSIPFELGKWQGKPVTVEVVTTFTNGVIETASFEGVLKFFNRFWLTVSHHQTAVTSYPLNTVTLSWDDRWGRLRLIVEETAKRKPVL